MCLEQKASCRLPRCFSSCSLLLPELGHKLPLNLPPCSLHSACFVQGPLTVLLLRTSQTKTKLLCKKKNPGRLHGTWCIFFERLNVHKLLEDGSFPQLWPRAPCPLAHTTTFKFFLSPLIGKCRRQMSFSPLSALQARQEISFLHRWIVWCGFLVSGHQ